MLPVNSRSESCDTLAKVEFVAGTIMVVIGVALIVMGHIAALAMSDYLLPGYIFLGGGVLCVLIGGLVEGVRRCINKTSIPNPILPSSNSIDSSLSDSNSSEEAAPQPPQPPQQPSVQSILPLSAPQVKNPCLIKTLVYLFPGGNNYLSQKKIYLHEEAIKSLFPNETAKRYVELADELFEVESSGYLGWNGQQTVLSPNQMGVSSDNKIFKKLPLPLVLRPCLKIKELEKVKAFVSVRKSEDKIWVVDRDALKSSTKSSPRLSYPFKRKEITTPFAANILIGTDMVATVQFDIGWDEWVQIVTKTEFEFKLSPNSYFKEALVPLTQTVLKFKSDREISHESILNIFQKKMAAQVDEESQFLETTCVWRRSESKDGVVLSEIVHGDSGPAEIALVDTLIPKIEIQIVPKPASQPNLQIRSDLTVVQRLEEMGVMGMPEEVNQVIQPIIDCRNPEMKELYKKWNKEAKKAVLLLGPPGTGKTSIGRAIGKILGLEDKAIRFVKASDILGKWVGDSEKNVADLFKPPEGVSFFMVLIDEIDSLVPPRGNELSKHHDGVVTEFLQVLDGIQTKKDFVLFAMTNNKNIDPALLRPGRFKTVEIGLPNITAREQIFKCYLRPLEQFFDFKIDEQIHAFAQLTEGYSGADIKDVVDRATERAFGLHLKGNLEAKVTVEDLMLQVAFHTKNKSKQV